MKREAGGVGGGGGAQVHVDRLVGGLRLLGLARVRRRLVAGPAVVVIAPPLLVGEDLVGFGNLHEHFLGTLLLVFIGVVFQGHFVVRLLDLGGVRVGRNAENAVKIGLLRVLRW